MKKTATSKFPTPSTIAILSLGVIVGLLQIALGAIAIAPQISPDYFREVKIHYNAFAKSLSFVHDFIDKVTLALYLRFFIASAQTVFGVLLLECGQYGSFSIVGNYGLIGINLCYLALQCLAGISYDRVAPTLIFLVLLITRLILIEQSSKKPKVGVKTRNEGKPKTSTPKKNKHD